MTEQVIQLRDTIESTANDLNQITSTLEIILSSMYDPEEESSQRDALTLLWRNLLTIRDDAFAAAMDVGYSYKVGGDLR